jgi:hypothetical protein
MIDGDDKEPLTAEEEWRVAIVGLQFRFMRKMLELLIAKKVINPDEARSLMDGFAKEMSTGAEAAADGVREVAIFFASKLEKMAVSFGELDPDPASRSGKRKERS